MHSPARNPLLSANMSQLLLMDVARNGIIIPAFMLVHFWTGTARRDQQFDWELPVAEVFSDLDFCQAGELQPSHLDMLIQKLASEMRNKRLQ